MLVGIVGLNGGNVGIGNSPDYKLKLHSIIAGGGATVLEEILINGDAQIQ